MENKKQKVIFLETFYALWDLYFEKYEYDYDSPFPWGAPWLWDPTFEFESDIEGQAARHFLDCKKQIKLEIEKNKIKKKK